MPYDLGFTPLQLTIIEEIVNLAVTEALTQLHPSHNVASTQNCVRETSLDLPLPTLALASSSPASSPLASSPLALAIASTALSRLASPSLASLELASTARVPPTSDSSLYLLATYLKDRPPGTIIRYPPNRPPGATAQFADPEHWDEEGIAQNGSERLERDV